MDWNVPEQPTTPQPDPKSRAASPGSAPRAPLSRRRFLGRAGAAAGALAVRRPGAGRLRHHQHRQQRELGFVGKALR